MDSSAKSTISGTDACIRAAGMASKLASGNGTASSLLKECQEKKAIGETHF